MAVQDPAPLNQVMYGGRDFTTLFDMAISRLKSKWGALYDDFEAAGLGIALVDLFCFIGDQQNWYLDRTAADLYLPTAQVESAVDAILRRFGYQMRAAASSGTDELLTFPATAFDAVISKGFRFQGPRSLQFEVSADVAVPAGSTTATVSIREGASQQMRFVGSGQKLQRLVLRRPAPNQFVARNRLRITVDGTEWTESAQLQFQATNQYEVRYRSDPPVVLFGDGVAGNVPGSGSSIVVEYVLTSGLSGNCIKGSIGSAIDQFLVGGVPVQMVVTNPLAATDGDDPETLDEARANAPSWYAARGTAVTTYDYFGLAGRFSDPEYGAVAKAVAVNPRTAASDPGVSGSLEAIGGSVIDLQVAIAAAVKDLLADQARLTTDMASADLSAAGPIGAQLSTALSALTTAQTRLVDAMTAEATAAGALGLLRDTVAQLKVVIGGLVAGTIAQAQIDNLTDLIGRVSDRTGVGASIAVELGTIEAAGADVETARRAAELAVTTANTALTTAALAWADAKLATADLSVHAALATVAVTTLMTAVASETSGLAGYLTGLFDSDGRSNLVTVPILSKDQDGFYSAPSQGLVQAVQRYLNGICETTQSVRVVSGANSMLVVNVTATLKLQKGAVKSVVEAAVSAAFDRLMRGRDFNVDLMLSDLYGAIKQIDKLGWSNIQLTPADPLALDPDGNVKPGPNRVVTKGTYQIDSKVVS